MRLEQLRYFIRVVECKSFNKAARGLFLTQPALTAAIKGLESELGFPLLMRHKKGILLTTLGERVYSDSKELLTNFENTVDEWKRAALEEKPQGSIKIMAIPTLCAYVASHIVPRFRENWPNLTLILEECSYINFDFNLRDRSARIVLTVTPEAEEEKACTIWQNLGYMTKPLLEDKYAILLGAGHPLSKLDQLDQQACSSLEFCSYAEEADVPTTPLNVFLRSLGKKPQIFLNNRETILDQLFTNRFAIVFLEKVMRAHWAVRQGLILIMPFSGLPTMPCRHYLLHLPDDMHTVAEKTFINYVCANYVDSIYK